MSAPSPVLNSPRPSNASDVSSHAMAESSTVKKVGRFILSFDRGPVAREILLDSDDYLRRMSPSERAIRMLSERTDISEEEFREHVAKQVVDWKDPMIQRIVASFERIDELTKGLNIKVPNPLHMVLTTGNEEIREAAAYCRANTIVLKTSTAYDGAFRTLIHELYHIQSQIDPEKRKELYALIGFTECNEIELPPELALKRLTNPDAPKLNTRIRVKVKDESFDVVPVLLYDKSRGYGFFSSLHIKMLAIENVGSNDQENWKYRKIDDKAIIFDPEECEDFISQVGENTNYNFHPEETMADNFRFMVLGAKVPVPRIPEGIKQIFMKV